MAILNAHWTGDLVNPIFAIDRNGIIRLWSRAGERLWGYSHDDVVGKPIWDLFPDSETKEKIFGDSAAGLRRKSFVLWHPFVFSG